MSRMRFATMALSVLALPCFSQASAQSSAERNRLLEEMESLRQQGVIDKKQLVALGASGHTGKPLICADYVPLIRADQRYVVSANQRLSLYGNLRQALLGDLFNKEEQFLSPAPEDFTNFAAFLKQPGAAVTSS